MHVTIKNNTVSNMQLLFFIYLASVVGGSFAIVLEEPTSVSATQGSCIGKLKYCLDGTVLRADPSNKCRFPRCPSPCPEDVKPCWDDTPWVIRNPKDPHCRFYQCKNKCPRGQSKGTCGGIVGTTCDDGYYCELGYQPNIADATGWCCQNVACTKDAKICDDGTVVGRDHNNNCQYFPCPKVCPEGGKASRKCTTAYPCDAEELCVYGTASVTPNTVGWCCPSSFMAEICRYEDHIWKDYLSFLEKHKSLVEIAPKKSKFRIVFDKVYEQINCINDLICKVQEKKEKIKNGEIDRNGIKMACCLWDWMKEIMEKADRIESLVEKLKSMLKGEKELKVVEEIGSLYGERFIWSFGSPQKLAYDVGHAVMMTLIPVEANHIYNASVICQKAEKLGNLFHRMLNNLGNIYFSGLKVFYEAPALFPAWWYNDLTQCIYDLAKLYYEIRECCGEIATSEVKIGKLVKKLGAWLKKAMDLREKLRKCLSSKIGYSLEKSILAINKEDKTIKDIAESIRKNVIRNFKGVLKEFDDCIIKLRCEFVKFVDQYWQPN